MRRSWTSYSISPSLPTSAARSVILMGHHAENSCFRYKKRGRRCLRADHHEALVEKLTQLTTRRGWELNILTAEELTPEQQINITARSTVRVLPLTRNSFSSAHITAGHSRCAWQWPHAPSPCTSWVRSDRDALSWWLHSLLLFHRGNSWSDVLCRSERHCGNPSSTCRVWIFHQPEGRERRRRFPWIKNPRAGSSCS